MLDTETRRRVDTARDILVGKVPDPKSQVEQITIALIYKFMDDMDAEAEEFGGERRFFAGEFARYGWANLMHGGLSGLEVLNLYADAVTRMPQNPGIPPLFRDIFNNAYLPYRDPEILRAFLKVIDEFTYDHSERLGDAFEYLLSVLGSQGDAGQFRTPRHIIDFIVEIVDPKKDETILDPACGTAGFLISSWKHILQTNTDENGICTLTPDEKRRLAQNFSGYDLSPDMVRLSLVNMYLHSIAQPRIHEYDTLTSDHRWNEYADVILANPPFMTPKGGIQPHSRFQVKSRRSEVLFLDYFVEHLTPRGRAGVIVPEGIHFVPHNAHVQLRRILIDGGFLYADITLPHGVFKPYASVKTHILLLDRVLASRSESVLFVEIENDGFSQSDTREVVSGSQLPAASQLIAHYRDAVNNGVDWRQACTDSIRAYEVKKSTLMEDPSIHILGRWHDLPNRVVHRNDVNLFRLGEICDVHEGLSPNMATTPGEYTLVVPAEDRKTSDHWDYEGIAICIPLVSSAGHGKADIKRIHYQEGRFALATTMCAAFVKDTVEVNPRYIYLFLNAACQQLLVPLMCGATNVTMSSVRLKEVLIPLPRRAVQDEIVESHLVRTSAEEMLLSANALNQQSSDTTVVRLTKQVIEDIERIITDSASKETIDGFLPIYRKYPN